MYAPATSNRVQPRLGRILLLLLVSVLCIGSFWYKQTHTTAMAPVTHIVAFGFKDSVSAEDIKKV